MLRLGTKLALFNLISKIVVTAIFIAILPFLINRINILQTDNELIKKREKIITLISEVGIEPFITSDTIEAFGSYNILKDEFISIERVELEEDWNFIEVSQRSIDNETIDYRVLNYSLKIDDNTYLIEIGKSLSSISYTQSNIKKIILIFLASIVLLTLLSDLFYTHRTLHPLKMIISKLKNTSTPSLFDNRQINSSTSDFVLLDNTLIDLMKKTDDLFNKEKEITVNISHELLTPVSVLRSKLENLLIQKNLDQDVAVKIEESLRTLHRLKTLINSLLFIARIEGSLYLKDETVNLQELLTEITNELNPIAADKNILITNEFESEYILSLANRSLIFSMLYNVVNNAIRNTQNEGRIVIKSIRNEGTFEVVVIDNGSGMNQEQINNLFSRFKTKHNATDEGTGIGLAITKTIADFHKIDIAVASKPGEGTKFSFIFP